MAVKVLMVCLGNICRSPLAEGILKEKVSPVEVQVDSAGTAGYHIGNPPDPRSVEVAKQHGIDISMQRCRKFTPIDLIEFDLIYVMDRQNYADVAVLAESDEQLNKIRLLLDNAEVPDPYYGGPQGFQQVFSMIDEACTRIAQSLRNG